MTERTAYTKPPMLGCGHAANAVDAEKRPVCAICIGIHPGYNVVVEAPSLEGRRARCSYYGGKCRSEADSDTALAFFERRPSEEYDRYYCGCYGWD